MQSGLPRVVAWVDGAPQLGDLSFLGRDEPLQFGDAAHGGAGFQLSHHFTRRPPTGRSARPRARSST